MARVMLILLSSSPSAPMHSVEAVRAVPGRGLEGDRYYEGKGTFSPPKHAPDFELTLIEEEQIGEFAKASGLPFTAYSARRNIVTSGVNLNALAGREFFIGNVRVRGIRLCEPCNYLAKISWPETLRGLVHKGGLRAQILTDGVIRGGDEIRVEPEPELSGSDPPAAAC